MIFSYEVTRGLISALFPTFKVTIVRVSLVV